MPVFVIINSVNAGHLACFLFNEFTACKLFKTIKVGIDAKWNASIFLFLHKIYQ